jgi:hypothetical protein
LQRYDNKFEIVLHMGLRVDAEQRADGVYVAAGVELIERVEYWTTVPRPNDRKRSLKIGDKIMEWELAQRLCAAAKVAPSQTAPQAAFLKACPCARAFVGDPQARYCPACKQAARLGSTCAAVRRLRAKQRGPLNRTCRQCGATMTARRLTKVFCSGVCRKAAHRQSRSPIGK